MPIGEPKTYSAVWLAWSMTAALLTPRSDRLNRSSARIGSMLHLTRAVANTTSLPASKRSVPFAVTADTHCAGAGHPEYEGGMVVGGRLASAHVYRLGMNEAAWLSFGSGSGSLVGGRCTQCAKQPPAIHSRLGGCRTGIRTRLTCDLQRCQCEGDTRCEGAGVHTPDRQPDARGAGGGAIRAVGGGPRCIHRLQVRTPAQQRALDKLQGNAGCGLPCMQSVRVCVHH